MKEAWADGRLDDLNHKVDEIGREMHAEFRAVRGEMNTRFNAMEKTLNLIIATMLGGFFTLLAAVLTTQL